MSETATGLVLRTRPLTETSLIVHWLTPEQGRLATVAKGARRAKSPFRGKLDLFYCADFSFNRSRRSELHTLVEVNLRETHRELRLEVGYLQQASYCTELIEQVTETETPLPGLYKLLGEVLAYLPNQPPQAQTVLTFELKLLGELGLGPDLAHSQLQVGTARLAEALTSSDWLGTARIKPSAAQIAELSRYLGGFLAFHLDRIPRERPAALRG